MFLFLFSALLLISAEKEITIKWFGQSCLLITSSDGTRILTDPAEFMGYHLPKGITADIVTVSHNHMDHNRVDLVGGKPEVIMGLTPNSSEVIKVDRKIKNIRVYNVSSYHNPGKNGLNAIFVFEFDGIRITHLGDIGITLTDDQVKAIGKIDILMIPVGGKYTIAGADADKIIEQLNVKSIVFPMHYKTDAFPGLPYSETDFLQGKKNVKRISGNSFAIDLSKMPSTIEFIVMDYKESVK
jgi:L-ascorbate metabolism protein UlaG (beta-lactamase superfamily)